MDLITLNSGLETPNRLLLTTPPEWDSSMSLTKDLRLDLEMLSLTSSEMEISATFSALPFSLVTKRSVLITRSTEMVLEMLLSLATTLLVFSRRLSSVELLLFRSLLP